jgi:hypothetical protein
MITPKIGYLGQPLHQLCSPGGQKAETLSYDAVDDIDNDARRFLDALQDRVSELMALSEMPKNNPDSINFERYQEFRKMMSECLSFSIIIERRIEQNKTSKKDELEEQFHKLTVAIWSVLLSGSLNFLTVICAQEYLPIGTNHVFAQELKTLYDAGKILNQDKFVKFMQPGIMDQRARAEKILEEIINRAPQLLDL